MRHRRLAAVILAAVALGVTSAPGVPRPVAAAEYTLESNATYEINADQREVDVHVDLAFTNTTPDPAGQFSIFEEIRLAVHDEATDIAASDDEGELGVADGVRTINGDEVHVVTIALRDGIRYEDSVNVELTYVLPDTPGTHLRVRPSLATFPAWAFGTSGDVRVAIPAGYEMRVDGDPLTEDGGELVSGPIDEPAAWLALVTAVAPAEYDSQGATVPLEGGTADLIVRSFPDDAEWGTRTLDVVTQALPLIERELGLPYPLLGQLILVEAVPATSAGFGESPTTGTEIPVSFDQPPFTALHQVTHVWLPPTLVEARWITEGLASRVAATVGEQLDIEAPFDPGAEAEANGDAAFALDSWPTSPDPQMDAYGYAASWALLDEIEELVGADAIPAVLARHASGFGPYEAREVGPDEAPDPAAEPDAPLTSRSFLDYLEGVSGADLTALFAERVLTESDVALLETRADARTAFDELISASNGWGAPDPVVSAMTDWRFEDATTLMADAREWLDEARGLLDEMEEAGLSAPERLHLAFRAYGGGAEALSELESEREVVAAYTVAAARVNAERSFIERLGLVGGSDPDRKLGMAAGRFTEGDLAGSMESIAEAERIMELAPTSGVVRIVSLLLLVVITAVLAVVLFRRRAYTAAP